MLLICILASNVLADASTDMKATKHLSRDWTYTVLVHLRLPMFVINSPTIHAVFVKLVWIENYIDNLFPDIRRRRLVSYFFNSDYGSPGIFVGGSNYGSSFSTFTWSPALNFLSLSFGTSMCRLFLPYFETLPMKCSFLLPMLTYVSTLIFKDFEALEYMSALFQPLLK